MVWRSELSFAVLNAYPYASGHLLVMPVRHVGELGRAHRAGVRRPLARHPRAVAAIVAAYDPDGVNMGANLGRAAGAGIPGAPPHARAAALVGRHQLHDRGGRGAGHARVARAGWERLHAAWPTD